MRCGKKQCYLESLWTFRYNKDIASEKTLKSGEKKGVTMDIIAKISEELGIRKNQAEAAVKLIDEGNTIPFIASGAQFIWQTGKIYIGEARAAVAQAGELPMLHVTDFISDMAAAYSAADLIISRAGAGSISEFCLLQKPVILVPSPNVAEDHQTKNALALVNKNAALYIKDAAAKEALLDKAVETVKQPETLKSLSTNIAKLAFTDSANVIAREVFKLADKYRKENGR